MLELGYKTANDWRPQIRFDSESARGGGRVKRRSPPTIGQFTVVVRDCGIAKTSVHLFQVQ